MRGLAYDEPGRMLGRRDLSLLPVEVVKVSELTLPEPFGWLRPASWRAAAGAFRRSVGAGAGLWRRDLCAGPHGRLAHQQRQRPIARPDLRVTLVEPMARRVAWLEEVVKTLDLSSVAVVWFGGHRIQSGQMRLGALTAFIAYILQILLAIMMAMYVLMTAPRAEVCPRRKTKSCLRKFSIFPPVTRS